MIPHGLRLGLVDLARCIEIKHNRDETAEPVDSSYGDRRGRSVTCGFVDLALRDLHCCCYSTSLLLMDVIIVTVVTVNIVIVDSGKRSCSIVHTATMRLSTNCVAGVARAHLACRYARRSVVALGAGTAQPCMVMLQLNT